MRNHSASHHSSGNNYMGSQGIQQLITAEKRAAEKVTDAKKRKARRIKQAREEADAEIERYRCQKEEQFIEYETRYMGNSEDIAAKIEHEANKQIEDYEQRVQKNKDAVIDDLISYVIDIEPVVPPNFFILKNFNKI